MLKVVATGVAVENFCTVVVVLKCVLIVPVVVTLVMLGEGGYVSVNIIIL